MCTVPPQPQEQGEVPARLGEKPRVAGVQPQESLTAGSDDATLPRYLTPPPARYTLEFAGCD